ncbi:MAG TPA: ABC transporter substrate-binding protein [Candidatus Binatia bacterium]
MTQIFVVLVTILVFHASVHAVDKIRIGISGLGSQFITFPLAQKRGFLKEEGFDSEIVRITGGATRVALASGDIDYSIGVAGMVGAAVVGVPVRVVACYLCAPVWVLMARPELKSVQALKGKTIGINAFGTAPEFIVRIMAKHFGLDPEREIKLIATGPPEARLASLTRGLVDATVLGPPFDFEAKKLGFNALANAHEIVSFPETGLIASVKKIQERPDEIKRTIRAGIKANRYIRSEREGTVQFMMDWLRINREVAVATYDSTAKIFSDDGNFPENIIRLVIEEAKKAAKVSREVAPSEVAELSILREAQRELGIKEK